MAGIQVGGIVSGMDTNSIVDQLIEQAQIPVDRLYGEYEYKQLEDEVYTNFNNMLGNLATDLLTLRLESTFKTKTTSSTNDSVVTATATTGSAVGSHSITVSQLAKNAVASSSYTRFALSTAGSSVTNVAGLSNDYLEGVHTVNVAASGSDYIATTEMKVSNVGMMSKSSGADIDGSLVDSYGELQADIAGSFTISYTDQNGASQTLTVDETFGYLADPDTGDPDDITVAMARLEYYVNEDLNTAMGTNAKQYVSFRAEYDSDAGTWSTAMYETSVDDYNIEIAGTDAGSLRDELGFAESYTPSTSTTTKIYKYHVGASLEDLEAKTFDDIGGVVSGAQFEVSGTLTEGSFVIAQDASLKVASKTYTTATGEAASSGSGIDTTAEGLDAAGFSGTVDESSTNGYFTINDIKITIDDYSTLTVNEVLGMINSSGAGVTATYDSSTDKFSIRSNTAGSSTVDIGAFNDTSNFLELLNLDDASSPAVTTGSTTGYIDSSTNLTNSGLTVYPYSGTFTINGVSIYVDTATESLDDVMEKVNKSGAGVTMSYDSVSDKVTMRADGIDQITVGSDEDTSNLLVALNLTYYPTLVKDIGDSGQRAILTVDGTTYTRESNTVSDIINGVTLSLNGEGTASTSIEVDTDKAVDAFASFIAHYNEVMAELNIPDADDDEDEYTSYLTDAEKENMTDDDIATYQEYYELYNKYDIIRRSSELRSLDTTMRKLFFAERPGINGSINDMSDLGIAVAGAGDLDTEFYGYLVEFSTDADEIAELLKDNSDFMTALSESPDDVYNFFANDPEEPEDGEDSSEYDASLGWARFYNEMLVDRYTGSEGVIGNKLGLNGSIESELSRLEDRIETQEARVESQLERYWAQFTAMEQAIADAQAQASSFSNASG